MAANLSFPLVKYSHATVAPGTRSDKVAWTHSSSDHMYVNLTGKDTTIRNGLLEMAIIRGTTTLDSVNLAAMIDARRNSQAAAAWGSTRGFYVQFSYPVDDRVDNETRRIQLRFNSVEQCQQVVGVIRARGLEFREPRPQTGHRPDTARSEFRPISAQPTYTNSPYFPDERPARPSAIRVPDMEAGSLSQRPTTRPGNSGSVKTLSTFNIAPPKINTRDERVAPHEVVPPRPSTSQMWRTNLNSNDHYTSLHSTEERHASTSQAANIETVYPSAAEDTSMEVERDSRPPGPSSDLRPSTSQSPNGDSHPSNTQWSSSPYHAQQRPASALSSSSSRPGSSRALMMAPLPKPKIVQNRTATPSYHTSSSLTKYSSPVRPASAMPSISVPDPTKHTRPGFSNASSRNEFDHASGQQETSNIRPMTAQPRPNEPLLVTELLARKKPLAERVNATTVQRTDSLADAPHEIESPPRINSAPKAHHAMFNRAFDALTGTARLAEGQALDEYSTQTPEDRLALMEQFVIDNLDNPSFMTLCEDIEKCWFGLSLGL